MDFIDPRSFKKQLVSVFRFQVSDFLHKRIPEHEGKQPTICSAPRNIWSTPAAWFLGPRAHEGLPHGRGRGACPSRVDLELAQSEFMVLLGPSGSGKSTLLNILGASTLPPPVRLCTEIAT